MNFYEDKGIDLLILINPDNPSGNFIPREDLLEICEWGKKKNIHILIDESFVDFAENIGNNSMLHNEILIRYPNLCVMKSISKSYGVPGLRLGVLATADTEVIAKMKKDVSIWNINSFAEFFLQIYGKYENDYLKGCRKFIQERDRFYNLLQDIDWLHVMPSQANYFLCEVTDKYTSKELTRILLEHDILISNCGLKKNMQGKNLIRLAVRSAEDNDRLIAVLKSL